MTSLIICRTQPRRCVRKTSPASEPETCPRVCNSIESFMVVSPSAVTDDQLKMAKGVFSPFGRPPSSFNIYWDISNRCDAATDVAHSPLRNARAAGPAVKRVWEWGLVVVKPASTGTRPVGFCVWRQTFLVIGVMLRRMLRTRRCKRRGPLALRLNEVGGYFGFASSGKGFSVFLNSSSVTNVDTAVGRSTPRQNLASCSPIVSRRRLTLRRSNCSLLRS